VGVEEGEVDWDVLGGQASHCRFLRGFIFELSRIVLMKSPLIRNFILCLVMARGIQRPP
jgi:hypothetical protein